MDDCITAVLWTRYYLYTQEYDVFENIVYQYNKSTIIFEKNGKDSISKCANHINIRYYFVTDNIEEIKST